MWCLVVAFGFHLICVSGINYGCSSCDGCPTIEWVVQPLLVASSQKWAVGCWCWASSMERWAGGKIVRALACGRECEVMMGGASLAGCADVLSGCGVVVWLAAQRLARWRWSEVWAGRSIGAEVDQLSVRWAWAARAWAVGGVSHERILRESSEI